MLKPSIRYSHHNSNKMSRSLRHCGLCIHGSDNHSTVIFLINQKLSKRNKGL